LQQISIVRCCNWWALTLRTVLFKYRMSYRHQTFMIATSKLLMKSYKNLICYLCIFNVQLHVHLKKWTLKFKPLYLRNCADYFNKICRICCVNTHIKSLKVWLKSILSWLKYSIFSMGLFFYWRTLYMSMLRNLFINIFSSFFRDDRKFSFWAWYVLLLAVVFYSYSCCFMS